MWKGGEYDVTRCWSTGQWPSCCWGESEYRVWLYAATCTVQVISSQPLAWLKQYRKITQPNNIKQQIIENTSYDTRPGNLLSPIMLLRRGEKLFSNSSPSTNCSSTSVFDVSDSSPISKLIFFSDTGVVMFKIQFTIYRCVFVPPIVLNSIYGLAIMCILFYWHIVVCAVYIRVHKWNNILTYCQCKCHHCYRSYKVYIDALNEYRYKCNKRIATDRQKVPASFSILMWSLLAKSSIHQIIKFAKT